MLLIIATLLFIPPLSSLTGFSVLPERPIFSSSFLISCKVTFFSHTMATFVTAERFSQSLSSWKTALILLFSIPSMLPASYFSRPINILRRVVFPRPDFPIIAVVFLSSRSNDLFSKTTFSPYFFERFLILIILSSLYLSHAKFYKTYENLLTYKSKYNNHNCP